MNKYLKAEKDVSDITINLIDAMQYVSPDKRIEVFDNLEDVWCRHCGFAQPIFVGFAHQKCQCDNDE